MFTSGHSHDVIDVFYTDTVVTVSYQVRVWSRTHSNAKKFASEIGAQLCETPEEAVTGADIICTVTFATTPIVQGKWIKEGAHINGGLYLH